LKLWVELGRFLDDVRIPLDNNASERALRRVALGRKNFLFVGDATSGENIAGLPSRCRRRARRAASTPHRRAPGFTPGRAAAGELGDSGAMTIAVTTTAAGRLLL
jgi:hypothetical protein